MAADHSAGERGVDAAIEGLLSVAPLRAWSLIVTIFGDLVLPHGDEIAAARLSQITERIGIRPEAFRVAVSRLAKDGWIIRQKLGRRSIYSLSKDRRSEALVASARIYADTPPAVSSFGIFAHPSEADPPLDAIQISPGLFFARDNNLSADCWRLDLSQGVPDWVKDRILSPELQSGYEALSQALSAARACAEAGAAPSDQLVLRSLAVHQWRRLLLRHADVPREFFPNGWQGETCRNELAHILRASDAAARNWMRNPT